MATGGECRDWMSGAPHPHPRALTDLVCGNDLEPLLDAAERHQEKHDCDFGHRVGEDAGCVADGDATGVGCGDVDVICGRAGQ